MNLFQLLKMKLRREYCRIVFSGVYLKCRLADLTDKRILNDGRPIEIRKEYMLLSQ